MASGVDEARGALLVRVREALSLKQLALATAARVEQRTLRRFEKGHSGVDLPQVIETLAKEAGAQQRYDLIDPLYEQWQTLTGGDGAFPEHPFPILRSYTDPRTLGGRAEEIRETLAALGRPTRIFAMYAPSGVGKSSFWLAGILPRLRFAGVSARLDRNPSEVGLIERLFQSSWPDSVEGLKGALAESPTRFLVLDQFEDVLRFDKTRRIGRLLAAGADCRWILLYRDDFHGEICAWLENVLRDDADAPRIDLRTPDRFFERPLQPLGSGVNALRAFQDAIERPLALRTPAGTPVWPWAFAPADCLRLARVFDRARRRQPVAPLTPVLQVVLARLHARARRSGDVVHIELPTDLDDLLDGALRQHVIDALTNAFPARRAERIREDRTRALIALQRLTDEAGRRRGRVPAAALGAMIEDDSGQILHKLTAWNVRLLVGEETPTGLAYSLSHDRLGEVLRTIEDEEVLGEAPVFDAEMLRAADFVSRRVTLHARGDAAALPVDRRLYVLIDRHAAVLLWSPERRAWWVAVRRWRRRRIGLWGGLAAASIIAAGGLAWLQLQSAAQEEVLEAREREVTAQREVIATKEQQTALLERSRKLIDELDRARRAHDFGRMHAARRALADGEPPTGTTAGAGIEISSVPARQAWSVAFSLDGQRMAIGRDDGLVDVRDARTGKRLIQLQAVGSRPVGHPKSVRQVHYTADGRWLVAAAYDGGVTFWAAQIGQPGADPTPIVRGRQAEYPRTGSVRYAPKAYAVTSGRQFLVAAYVDGISELYDLQSHIALARHGMTNQASWVGLNAAEDRAVLVSQRKGAVIMEITASGWRPMAILAPEDSTLAVAVTGPSHVAMAWQSGVVQVWRLADGQRTRRFQARIGAISAIAMDAERTLYVGASRELAAFAPDQETPRWWIRLPGPIRSVSTDLPGQLLILLQDRRVLRLDARFGVSLGTYGLAAESPLVVKAKGDLLAASGLDPTIDLWSLRAHPLTGVLPIKATAIVQDGDVAYIATAAGQIYHWSKGTKTRLVAHHGGPIEGLKRQGTSMATWDDRTVRVWQDGVLVESVDRRGRLMALGPEGQLLFEEADGQLSFHRADGATLRIAAPRPVSALTAHLADDRFIVAWREGHLASIDARSGRLIDAWHDIEWRIDRFVGQAPLLVGTEGAQNHLHLLDPDLGPISRSLIKRVASCLTATADGRRVAVGTLRGRILLTDTVDIDSTLRQLATTNGRVEDAWFLHDDRLLAGFVDGVIKVWEVETGRIVEEIDGLVIEQAAVFKDGRLLLRTKDGHLVYGQIATPEALRRRAATITNLRACPSGEAIVPVVPYPGEDDGFAPADACPTDTASRAP